MARRPLCLPENLAPVGINREQAAAYIGVSTSTFDRLVAHGAMPDGRMIFGRIVWDVAEVTAAFRAIPHRSESLGVIDAAGGGANPWDHASA